MGEVLPYDWFPLEVPDNVVLGDDADLWSAMAFLEYRSTRTEGVRIGRFSGVYPGVMFDLGPQGGVTIGDYCMLGEVTFATNHRIEIGDHCLVARETMLADGPMTLPAPTDRLPGFEDDEPVITLGDNVWVGQHCLLLPGAHIGDDAIIGMGTTVDFVVEPGAIVAGDPPRRVGWSRRGDGR
jgi:acetyltransferase-like isoleucine patch superfamily enzyme